MGREVRRGSEGMCTRAGLSWGWGGAERKGRDVGGA